ncbi:MAG: hypothetical protein PHW04_12470 [Candidatus Wallbacteria bacterium]|nr:hypothetical protein [Candidatus Wallbacteria bacterium]
MELYKYYQDLRKTAPTMAVSEKMASEIADKVNSRRNLLQSNLIISVLVLLSAFIYCISLGSPALPVNDASGSMLIYAVDLALRIAVSLGLFLTLVTLVFTSIYSLAENRFHSFRLKFETKMEGI